MKDIIDESPDKLYNEEEYLKTILSIEKVEK